MEIKLRLRYTEGEWLKASRLLMFADKRSLLSIPIVLASLFIFSFMVAELLVISIPFWALSAASLLLGAAWMRQIFVDAPRRFFRSDRRTRDEWGIAFTEEGVALQTTIGESKLAWSAYEKVYESKDLYVIAMARDLRMMTVVPKRAFRDSNEEFEFRRLLRSHVDANLPVKTIEGRSPAEQQYIPSSSGPPDWR
jgi:hypothetical protein